MPEVSSQTSAIFESSREVSKKKQPDLPPEDGFHVFKGGFLTLGSTSFQAFPSFMKDSGMI
jgi:hypothetical protein